MKEMRKKQFHIPLTAALTAAALLILSFSACSREEESAGLSESAPSSSVSSSNSASSDVSQSVSSEGNGEVLSGGTSSSSSASHESAVDDSYFSDVLFVGDSLTNGLYLYGDIKTADYCYETSATAAGVTNVTPLLSMLASKKYGKIYILLGINEMGSGTSSYIANYEKLIDTVRARQPNAVIVLQTILPTNPAMTWDASIFSVENVQAKNRALAELAQRKGAVLVDTYSAYADGNGMMPADYCRDGVHPHASYYSIWCDYLRAHMVSS